MRYFPSKIEKKWQKKWFAEKTYEPDFSIRRAQDKLRAKKPFYNLMMFPYPSAEGLHVGNMYAFTGADIYGRFMRMRGLDVFEPIGLDGFGIHSENFAMKVGRHPADQAKISEKNFYRQLEMIGNGFAWRERLETYDPEYYRWTQWIFVQMFKRGLAYRKKQAVNWCLGCKTVLADEQVVSGECERCGTRVIKKELEQWFFKITDYAERLLQNLEKMDWSERVKIAQKNWIGKSEGASIKFPISLPDRQASNFRFPIKDLDFVFIHGYKGNSRDIFWPWFRKEVERRGAKVFAPDLPNSDAPNINEQVQYVLKQHSFSEKTVIVTHSLGGVVAMKLLPLLHDKIERLLLVAPPLRTEFLDGKRRPALEGACDWKFNFNEIKKHARNISVLADTQDHIVSMDQLVEIAGQLNAKLRKTVANTPHFREIVEPEILKELFPEIEIFTTRPDTLFGATYLVLSPEHPVLQNQESRIKNQKEIDDYIKRAKAKTEEERIAESKDSSTGSGQEKTGVELKGIKAINPANGEEIPIWVADYVLGNVGTGAIMAVPAHDERDFEFAKKFKLPIKRVIAPFFEDEMSRRKDGFKTVTRKTIYAVLRNPKKNEYLVLDWPKYKWHTFVIGGVEDGEDAVVAAAREIAEETGYSNIRFVKSLGRQIGAYFAAHKNENRIADAEGLLFDLIDEKRINVDFEHSKNHKVFWLKEGEVANFVNISSQQYAWDQFQGKSAYSGGGILINSGKFNEMDSEKAKWEIAKLVGGERKVKYRLRDWLISRQRYWGSPIPMIKCEKCGWQSVPEKDLPVKLPYVKNFRPTGTDKSPLATVEKFYKVRCPKCKNWARRETDVSDTFLDSAWYYLGYLMKFENWKLKIGNSALTKLTRQWLPVNSYIGGAEHSVLHLLYSRFLAMVFKDLGLTHFEEPFTKFRAHGLLIKDDAKMSKSKGNVVNPDEYVHVYGADALRMYLMFLGPFEQGGDFRDTGIRGITRFLDRVWNFVQRSGVENSKIKMQNSKLHFKIQNDKIEKSLNKTVKKVTEDIENLQYNTAISALMMLLNAFEENKEKVTKEHVLTFLKLLAPFAPHITEELWQNTNQESIRQLADKNHGFKSIHKERWPEFNLKSIVEDTFELVVQINGKMRDKFEAPVDIFEKEAIELTLAREKVKNILGSSKPHKVIFIPKRLINIVV